MEGTTYTVTRALVELKTVAKKINKLINNSTFLDYDVPNQKRNHDAVDCAVSNYQAVRDLINFRNRIKYAIIASNAVTKVRVGGQEYTVAEAIDMKESVGFLRELLDKLRTQRNSVRSTLEYHNQQAQAKLDRLLEVEFGKGQKSDVTHISSITDAFMKSNRGELVDPLNVDEKILQLEETVEGFEREVDFALSESNATTHITV